MADAFLTEIRIVLSIFMPRQIWVVRAGQDSTYIQEFLSRKIVAIGWSSLGDLTDVHGRDAFVALMKAHYPDYTSPQIATNAGQVYRFRDELTRDSFVLTYDSGTRRYHLGKILGGYEFHPEFDPELQHTKAVQWITVLERDELSPETRNSLGSIAAVFCISQNATDEVLARMSIGTAPAIVAESVENAEAGESEVRRDTEQRALEFLQDRLAKLGWSEMQELVAGLLRAMGYKTHISPPGPDRGRDVFASPDGFGFQTPRIIVEVKHRNGTMGAQDIRAFSGVLRNADNGLYVSTGGFTREARYEAERAMHHIALMDALDLGKAIVEHYDEMDAATRTLLPLRKIYWPV